MCQQDAAGWLVQPCSVPRQRRTAMKKSRTPPHSIRSQTRRLTCPFKLELRPMWRFSRNVGFVTISTFVLTHLLVHKPKTVTNVTANCGNYSYSTHFLSHFVDFVLSFLHSPKSNTAKGKSKMSRLRLTRSHSPGVNTFTSSAAGVPSSTEVREGTYTRLHASGEGGGATAASRGSGGNERAQVRAPLPPLLPTQHTRLLSARSCSRLCCVGSKHKRHALCSHTSCSFGCCGNCDFFGVALL